MLQIFIPVVGALLVALVGYRFSLRADLRAKAAQARLEIQRHALEEAQKSLADYWICAAKLLRSENHEDLLRKKDLLLSLQSSSTELTIAYSRLHDRQLANDVVDWQHSIAQRMQFGPASKDVVAEEHLTFVKLSDRLGSALRDLTYIPWRDIAQGSA